MKKKILGTSFGILAMIAFASFNTINTAEAQEITHEQDQKSWDLVVCIHPGSNPTAACAQPAIAGPCWKYTPC